MTQAKRIGIVATLDTKGEHVSFIKALIEQRGHEPVLLDIGVLGQPAIAATFSREEIARAGGVELASLITAHDRGKALQIMTVGLTLILKKLQREGYIDAVIGLGGGGGTSVASAAMRALPVGIPKVMVSTMTATNKGPTFIGTRDVVMFNSITDIMGMNPILRSVLSNATAAVCGMAESGAGGGIHQLGERPTVAITAFGVTTIAAMRCSALLTEAGF
jgi:uncharacterized protein (UPF0261 family)